MRAMQKGFAAPSHAAVSYLACQKMFSCPPPLPASRAFCASACWCLQDFSKTGWESKRGLMIPALLYFCWLQLVWIFPSRELFCALRKNKSTGGRDDTSSRNEANRVYTHDTYEPVTFKRYGLWYFKTKRARDLGG